MSERPSIRWGLAFGHAFLALVVVAVVTGTLAAVLGLADPKKFGEGVGRLSLFFMVGGFGASCLAQTGRRRIALALRIGMLLMLAGIAAFVMKSVDAERDRAKPSALPKVDVIREHGVIRHPVLGFSVPDPGSAFEEQPALGAQLTNEANGSRAWVYADLEESTMVTLVLASDVGRSRESFEGFFNGFLAGQLNSMNKDLGDVAEKTRTLNWDERRASAHTIAATFHVRVDAFALPTGEGLIIMTLSADEERFEGLAGEVILP